MDGVDSLLQLTPTADTEESTMMQLSTVSLSLGGDKDHNAAQREAFDRSLIRPSLEKRPVIRSGLFRAHYHLYAKVPLPKLRLAGPSAEISEIIVD
jgi:hypothetical protein